MLLITFEGDAAFRQQLLELDALKSDDVSIGEVNGMTGLDALQVALEYGPLAVSLLKEIVDLVDAGIRLKKDWKLSIESNEAKNDTKRP